MKPERLANRTILRLGLLICVGVAVLGAYLLGLLDWIGALR